MIMRYILLVGLLSGFALGVVAQEQSVAPQVRFAESSIFNVDATSFEIVVQDQTPRTYPQVGYLSPTTYEQALRTWVVQRFQLTGNSVNKLRITLREGRITEKILPIQKGIRGWFKKEEAVQYDGSLNLEIAIIDPNGVVLTKAESAASVTQTLIEGATQPQKEAAWVGMINTTFDNADRELKGRFAESMGGYFK